MDRGWWSQEQVSGEQASRTSGSVPGIRGQIRDGWRPVTDRQVSTRSPFDTTHAHSEAALGARTSMHVGPAWGLGAGCSTVSGKASAGPSL